MKITKPTYYFFRRTRYGIFILRLPIQVTLFLLLRSLLGVWFWLMDSQYSPNTIRRKLQNFRNAICGPQKKKPYVVFLGGLVFLVFMGVVVYFVIYAIEMDIVNEMLISLGVSCIGAILLIFISAFLRQMCIWSNYLVFRVTGRDSMKRGSSTTATTTRVSSTAAMNNKATSRGPSFYEKSGTMTQEYEIDKTLGTMAALSNILQKRTLSNLANNSFTRSGTTTKREQSRPKYELQFYEPVDVNSLGVGIGPGEVFVETCTRKKVTSVLLFSFIHPFFHARLHSLYLETSADVTLN